MKSANNPFNLHIGDRVTLEDDDNNLSYGVIGFTDDGLPTVEITWARLGAKASVIGGGERAWARFSVKANEIELVIRKEKS